MEQVGQRKIDGMWLMVVGIAVLFFLILPTLIVIPMSFSGASFLEFPPTVSYQHLTLPNTPPVETPADARLITTK